MENKTEPTSIPVEELVEQANVPDVLQPLNCPKDDDVINYLHSLWGNENDNVRELNELSEEIVIKDEILDTFKKNIEDRFDSLKVLNNFKYINKLEKETRLKKNELTKDDIKLSYIAVRDLLISNKINNKTMNAINKVYISLKIKDENKNHLDIKNYRFIQIHSKTIKLIDRIWCLRVISLIKNLNLDIFKSNLARDMNITTIDTASYNTLSRDNVVLIDLEKAFDNCDYDVVEKLIFKSFCSKINETIASNLTKQYMYIIRQREIYYKNNKINFRKGLPTGLPSSNIIFSLIMDSIINEWLEENKGAFRINSDFIINIYVDDIYLKILNIELKEILVVTLIDKIKKYKFNVNFEKCKADEKLQLEFFTNLEESDLYLGIPFTRDIRKYTEIILKRYGNETYKELYQKLITGHNDSKKIYGYFNYKLKPLLINEETILSFIEKYLI